MQATRIDLYSYLLLCKHMSLDYLQERFPNVPQRTNRRRLKREEFISMLKDRNVDIAHLFTTMPTVYDVLKMNTRVTFQDLIDNFPLVSYKGVVGKKLTRIQFIDRLVTLGISIPNHMLPKPVDGPNPIENQLLQFAKDDELEILKQRLGSDRLNSTCDFPPTINHTTNKSLYSETRMRLNSYFMSEEMVCAVCSVRSSVHDPNYSFNRIDFSSFPNIEKIKWRTPKLYFPFPDGMRLIEHSVFDNDFMFLDFPQLNGYAVDEKGIHLSEGKCLLNVCNVCETGLRSERCKIPRFAIANGYYHKFPSELPQLNFIEIKCISRLQVSDCIVKVTESRMGSQLGFRGHFLARPQNPDRLLTILPMPMHQLSEKIHIILVRQKNGETPTLSTYKNLLTVSREKIRVWLEWLKLNNPYYIDVQISLPLLNEFPENEVPNFANITSEVVDYVNADFLAENGVEPNIGLEHPPQSLSELQGSSIFDESGSAMSLDEIFSGVLRTFENEDIAFSLPKDTIALISKDELMWQSNPLYYPYAFPHLFPYGLSHPEMKRFGNVTFREKIKHYLSIDNPVFRRDLKFLFNGYDRILKSQIFSSIKFKVQSMKTTKIQNIASVTKSDLEDALKARFSSEHDSSNPANSLFQTINLVNNKIEFSQESKGRNRQELRASIVRFGSPSFYVTISPSDSHHVFAFIKCMEGTAFDINNPPEEMTNRYFRNKQCAKNPVALAQFFNVLIAMILESLFGWKNPNKIGILGPMKCYYGMVKSRGTLHIHLLIWIEGQPDIFLLNERLQEDTTLRDMMIRYLDSVIDTDNCVFGPVPEDIDPTSCSYSQLLDPESLEFNKNVGKIASAACQTYQLHTHCKSCFKKSKKCRYRKPSPCYAYSHFDEDSGAIHQRKFNGMINNFNRYLTLITMSNTDISFCNFGESTLAITHYITNYLTKSSVGVDNEYVIAQAALKKTLETPLNSDARLSSEQNKVKDLLVRYQFALRTCTQISANEIATRLLNLPMAYTSHDYSTIFLYQVFNQFKSTLLNVTQTSHSEITFDYNGNPLYTVDVDYIYRPNCLKDLSLYEFVSHVRKTKRSSAHFSFLNDHPQAATHGICLRDEPSVPVIYGNLGRADANSESESFDYKLTMCLLFQPWTSPDDIDFDFLTHDAVFSKKIMANIQLLHRSKDDAAKYKLSREQEESQIFSEMDVFSADDEYGATSSMLLNSVSESEWQFFFDHTDLSIISCMESFRQKDKYLYDAVQPFLWNDSDPNQNSMGDFTPQWCCYDTDISEVPIRQWKYNVSNIEKIYEELTSQEHNNLSVNMESNNNELTVDSGLNLETELALNLVSLTHMNNDMHANPFDESMALSSIIDFSRYRMEILNSFSMNEQQQKAFDLFYDAYTRTRNSENPYPEDAIRVFVGGEGGTGKSRIINAIREFLVLMDQKNILRIMAFTGSAAFQIQGNTVHKY